MLASATKFFQPAGVVEESLKDIPHFEVFAGETLLNYMDGLRDQFVNCGQTPFRIGIKIAQSPDDQGRQRCGLPGQKETDGIAGLGIAFEEERFPRSFLLVIRCT